MGWYTQKVKKVTFEEFGAPNLYVVFKDMNSLPYGQARAMQKRYENLDKDNPSQEAAEDILSEVIPLIIEWNVTHPETGEALPRPTNIDGFEVLPMEVLMHILQGGLGGEAPLVTENDSKPALGQ